MKVSDEMVAHHEDVEVQARPGSSCSLVPLGMQIHMTGVKHV
jgi:hypothetical protein